MNIDTLMSAIREMVHAEVYVQMFAAGVLHAPPDQRESWGQRYSAAEAQVRRQLAELDAKASAYKEPPRYGPSRLAPDAELMTAAIGYPLPYVGGSTEGIDPAPHAAVPLIPSPSRTVVLGG